MIPMMIIAVMSIAALSVCMAGSFEPNKSARIVTTRNMAQRNISPRPSPDIWKPQSACLSVFQFIRNNRCIGRTVEGVLSVWNWRPNTSLLLEVFLAELSLLSSVNLIWRREMSTNRTEVQVPERDADNISGSDWTTISRNIEIPDPAVTHSVSGLRVQ